ncbi:hypothetical protein GCM10029964_129030 [Kibdelosporangium lantanae]
MVEVGRYWVDAGQLDVVLGLEHLDGLADFRYGGRCQCHKIEWYFVETYEGMDLNMEGVISNVSDSRRMCYQ